MKFVRDLNNEQLIELLLKSDEQYVRRTFGTLAELTREAAEQPDGFWRLQQIQIRTKVSLMEKHSSRAVMTVASAVALMLLAFVLIKPDSRVAPASPLLDPDQALLISVEHAVRSDVPAALEPAALLSDEIISDSQLRPASQKKGKGERQ